MLIKIKNYDDLSDSEKLQFKKLERIERYMKKIFFFSLVFFIGFFFGFGHVYNHKDNPLQLYSYEYGVKDNK